MTHPLNSSGPARHTSHVSHHGRHRHPTCPKAPRDTIGLRQVAPGDGTPSGGVWGYLGGDRQGQDHCLRYRIDPEGDLEQRRASRRRRQEAPYRAPWMGLTAAFSRPRG